MTHLTHTLYSIVCIIYIYITHIAINIMFICKYHQNQKCYNTQYDETEWQRAKHLYTCALPVCNRYYCLKVNVRRQTQVGYVYSSSRLQQQSTTACCAIACDCGCYRLCSKGRVSLWYTESEQFCILSVTRWITLFFIYIGR